MAIRRNDIEETKASANRAEVVEILAGAVFKLLLEGRFGARRHDDHHGSEGTHGADNRLGSDSESPCVVHQRTRSCPSPAAPDSCPQEGTK